MDKKTQERLAKLLGSVVEAVELRDAEALKKALGDAVVSGGGSVRPAADAVKFLESLSNHVEDVSVRLSDPTGLHAGKDRVVAVLPIELSFVETKGWTFRRHQGSAVVTFTKLKSGWALTQLTFHDMRHLPSTVPELGGIGGASPVEGPVAMPVGSFGPYGYPPPVYAVAPHMQSWAAPMTHLQPWPGPIPPWPGPMPLPWPGPIPHPQPWPGPMPMPWPGPIPAPWPGPWPGPDPRPWGGVSL